MSKHHDLKGKKFGRWTALVYVGNSQWLCQCDCGTVKNVDTYSLRSAGTKSCGCIKKKYDKQLKCWDIREYRIWSGMRGRCYGHHHSNINYKQRGIKICDRWDKFENFIEDMGAAPTNKHTLERMNNNGNYTPENCKWATRKQQNRNHRRNRRITFKGETKILVEWSETLGINYNTLTKRLNSGWPIEKALTEEIEKRPRKKRG